MRKKGKLPDARRIAAVFMASLVLSQGAAVFSFAADTESSVSSSITEPRDGLGEYEQSDIEWIVDKMAYLTARQKIKCNVHDIYSDTMLALYRSKSGEISEFEDHWLDIMKSYVHQQVDGMVNTNMQSLELGIALMLAGYDLTDVEGTDIYASPRREAEFYKRDFGMRDLLKFMQGTELYAEIYDDAYDIMSNVIEAWLKNYKVIKGNANYPNVSLDSAMVTMVDFYHTGDEELDKLLEYAIKYCAGGINEYDNTWLISILCAMGIDPSKTEAELSAIGETISLSVNGESLMAHLLSQLCDSDCKLLSRSEAANADGLAITYTEYEYGNPIVTLDMREGFFAVVAYERFLNGEGSIWRTDDIAKSEKAPSGNRAPEISFFSYVTVKDAKIIKTGQSVKLPCPFADADEDELTYFISEDGAEARKTEKSYGPENGSDTSEAYGLYYTHDPQKITDGHQTVTLTLYAVDPHGEKSPDYTVVIEVYDEPDIYWLKYEVGENAVTIYGCDENATELVIPETIEGKPVTNIAPNAFYGRRKLKSVSIPDSVMTIGKEAFKSCTLLEKVNLPSSLKQMGEDAFDSCESLCEITIPASLSEFYPGCFDGCTKLRFKASDDSEFFSSQDGTLYNKDKTVLLRAGYQEDGVFIIPDSVTEIGEGAFYTLDLKKVVFGKNVKTVGEQAFSYCAAEEYIFNEGLVTIGDYAFRQVLYADYMQLSRVFSEGGELNPGMEFEFPEISELVFPSTLESIGKGAFVGMRGLKRADLSKTRLTKITDSAFMGSSVREVLLPDTLIDIESYAFSVTGLVSIELPDSVIHLGEYAFALSSDLEHLDLGNSVRELEENAIPWNSRIGSITFPSSLRKIGSDSLNIYGKAYFEGNYPENVSIARFENSEVYRLDNAYGWENKDFAEVYEPTEGEARLILHLDPESEMIGIGDVSDEVRVTAAGGADASNITWTSSDLRVAMVSADGRIAGVGEGNAVITAQSGNAKGEVTVMVVEDKTFEWSLNWDNTVSISGLNDRSVIDENDGVLNVPETICGYPVTEISLVGLDFPRVPIEGLREVNLPDSIKKIGDFAFYFCTDLEKVNFPEGIEVIGTYAFCSTSIKEVNLPDSLKELGGHSFADCEELETVVINCPELSDVFGYNGSYAFRNCTSLEELELISIPTIGQGMFAGDSSLISVELPENINRIDSSAFTGCINLESVEFPKYLVNSSTYINSDYNPFYGVSENFTLLHPDDGNMWDGLYGLGGSSVSISANGSSSDARVFEIMQNMLDENPAVLALGGVSLVLIAVFGAVRRYLRLKKEN